MFYLCIYDLYKQQQQKTINHFVIGLRLQANFPIISVSHSYSGPKYFRVPQGLFAVLNHCQAWKSISLARF